MMLTDLDAGCTGGPLYYSITGYLNSGHSATCTASGDGRYCGCHSYPSFRPVPTPAIDQGEKRPKYDPHNARQLWRPEAMAVTSKPGKRPRCQVEFNQVSRRRPARPRYLSRKR